MNILYVIIFHIEKGKFKAGKDLKDFPSRGRGTLEKVGFGELVQSVHV